MKKNIFVVGALASLLTLPTSAMADNVIVNGAVIDWFYYGKDYADGTTGWNQAGPGSVDQPSNIGLLSFGLDPNASDDQPVWLVDFPIRHNLFYANSSGVFTGDAYYTFFQHETGWEDNMETEYGTESWETVVRKWTWDEGYTNLKYETVGKIHYSITDMTYDPVNDVVYGIFYMTSGDMDGYKLCTIDLETLKVTPISREAMMTSSELRCLAINSKGQLYGIDASGNVFKVSKEDGQLTQIGNVGFKSQRRMMSATFDLRTDKLYWLGYMNDGKKDPTNTSGTNNTLSVADGGRDTGFYEVDTETGAATLIGKTDTKPEPVWNEATQTYITKREGKFQLTGIYVDGSFTKKQVDQKISLVSAPKQMAPGEQGTMTVNVKNIGLTKVSAKNYKINFYLNGQLINTIDRDGDKDGNEDYAAEAMEVGKSQTFAISFTAPNAASAKIYAEVVNEADEEARNNKTEEASIVIIGAKTLPAPQLTGSKTDNGITITWQDPKGKVVEGAENFAAFTYDGLADWTMYDGDQGYTQKPSSYNMAVNYPNWSMPKAFIVFNPEQAGLNLTGSAAMFIPHSGDQYFAGFFTAVPSDNEEGYEEVTCDDWMISPRLSGQAQTVSFWAKGYQGSVATGYETEASFIETLQILASKGEDTDLADFEVVTETFEVNAEEWTKYTVDLPEGTNFFAIHRNTEAGNAFVLLIDDINFEVEAQTVQGYNIYKNGALVANQKSTSYTDADGAGTDIYTVTAVYADGESGQSNKFWADAPSGSTVKGDANGDGELDVRDVMLMTNFLMYHGTQSTNADVNGDGEVDIRDIVALIDLLMKE